MNPDPQDEKPVFTPSDSELGGAAPNLFDKVFLGADGIRAGWRAALYVTLFVIFAVALQAAEMALRGNLVIQLSSQITAGTVFAQEVVLAISALGAARVMALFEHRRFGEYGMPWRGALGKPFWQGALWGLLGISAIMLLMRALGGFSFGDVALRGGDIARYALIWAAVFFLVGITEEFLFRGYLQFTLSSGMGFWPAAILLSAGFGAVHLRNPGEGIPGALSVFVVGMFLCLTLRRTGTLWFAIGWHAAWDFAETYLYSVPDSGLVMPGQLLSASLHGPRWLTGGSVGPEGSALAFAMIGLMWLAFDHVYRPQVNAPHNAPDNAPDNAQHEENLPPN